MNLFVPVRKKIKEMINESALIRAGLLFLLLGVLEISIVEFCWWMDIGSAGVYAFRSGSEILLDVIIIICELLHVKQIGIIKCSIGALLLIIHMVKKICTLKMI